VDPAALVTLCAREPEGVGPGEIARAAAAEDDWDAVCAMSARNQVEALVEASLRRHAGTAVPNHARSNLAGLVARGVASTMRIESELREVVAGLAASGVRALVLKGAAVALGYYPSPALRRYRDVDLVVRARHMAQAQAALTGLGLAPLPLTDGAERRAHRLPAGIEFHSQWVTPTSRTLFELHGDALQLGVPCADEDGRWERALPIPGLEHGLMLAAEDQVVQLGVHAHKHGFERLVWLKDIDLVVRRAGGLDCERVAALSRLEGVRASVWYALALAEDLLGTPVPWERVRDLRPPPAVRALLGLTCPRRRVRELRGVMRRRFVQFDPRDSWRGMVPSLLLMGRRGARLQAVTRYVTRSLLPPPG
jgi:hypothetical protein